MGSEFPKWLKIVFLINVALCFAYGINKAFLPIAYADNLANWTGIDYSVLLLGYIRADGYLLLALGVFVLFLIRINDWEKCKLFFEFILVLHVIMLINNATAPTGPGWDGIIIHSIFIVLYGYYYYTQIKK